MVWLPLDMLLTLRHDAAVERAIFVRMQRIVSTQLAFRCKSLERARAVAPARGGTLNNAVRSGVPFV